MVAMVSKLESDFEVFQLLDEPCISVIERFIKKVKKTFFEVIL